MSLSMRSLSGELQKFIDKKIVVKLVDGREYRGILLGFDPNNLHLVLGDAESGDGSKYFRVFISGGRISEILVVERSLFDAEEFANLVRERLGLPQGVVRVLPEINAVLIYERIKVTEAGVEGSGPLAQRVYDVFNEYIESKKKGGRS